MTQRSFFLIGLLFTLSGCNSLLHEPWTYFKQGEHSVGVSTGWTALETDASLDPASGSEGPIDEPDSGDFEPDPSYVAALRYDYFLTDNWILGTRIEWRGFHAQDFELTDRDIDLHDYGTMHFVETLRYLFEPIDEEKRLRPFAGAELSYVPEIDLRADVSGPDGDSPEERIRFRGSGFYKLGATGGFSYLWADDTLLEVGALYEIPLGKSEDEVMFGDPLDPSTTDWELETEGLVLFVTLMVSF